MYTNPMQPPNKATDIQLDVTSDLQRWRAFLAIAQLGSLTRAALFLNSNQSMLSRHLNALERECNARLFNRTGRGVSLSDVGERILPLVQELLSDAEQLELEIRGTARDPVGRVTIGSLPSITNPIVGQLFERLRSLYPGIQLKFLEGSSGQVDEWLADARIDIAILYRYGANLSEHEQLLATVDSYLIGAAGDELTASKEIPFASLDNLPFALPGAPNGLRTTLDAIAHQQHICLEPAIEADSLPLMRSLVAEAKLYTVLPIHAVWGEVGEGRLQASKIIDPVIQRKVTMALARSKGPSKAVTTVAAEIVKIVEEKRHDGMWSAELKGDLSSKQ